MKRLKIVDKKNVSVYVNPDTYESLVKLAESNDRSISNQVALIIKNAIEQDDPVQVS